MIRKAVRVLTGRPSHDVTVSLGHRSDGAPGVTLATFGRGMWCFTSPEALRRLRDQLTPAIAHLEGSTP
ncbi:hypothetical protein [Umezawaea sp. Da 62-37]|uniref:hypothetical protein n=1 Tax=Umezawaea sp. Da 62-37 TaxID=3075927 RepID=UPI0028F6E281|nr:hypothetical protein [Umezawaea sp. Da 62-37]WNV90335.1 hypothetical protein RM788_19255 [Umezawaea sp. Da 62-37]